RLHQLVAVGLLFRNRTEIALVEPSFRLLGKDAGNALPMQVGPTVAAAIETDRKILDALGTDFLHFVPHDRLGVLEFDRRQTALVVAAGASAVAGLSDRAQEGIDGVADVGGIQ